MNKKLNSEVTHKDLVELSYKWILTTGGMSVAFKELHSLAKEVPDVIGFNSYESMVIECKTSRSDFLKDKNKPHRKLGMGEWRFFCCPEGLIKVEELPKKWGLIYIKNWKASTVYDCRKKKEPIPENLKGLVSYTHYTIVDEGNRHEADLVSERRLMFTVIRRLFIKGFVKHIYDKDYNRGSTQNNLILLNSNPNE